MKSSSSYGRLAVSMLYLGAASPALEGERAKAPRNNRLCCPRSTLGIWVAELGFTPGSINLGWLLRAAGWLGRGGVSANCTLGLL